MEMQQERPPAYTQHEHDPETLHLPAVPTHPLSTSSSHENDRLPSIRALALPDATRAARSHSQRPSVELSPRSQFPQAQWGSLPPLNGALPTALSARPAEGIPRHSNEMDVGSPMDTASVASAQDDVLRPREMSVISVDDPDVRLAAEALSGLGNPGLCTSFAYR